MVTLISKWKLKNGCPPELLTALQELAAQVRRDEPGTLLYLVNLEASDLLGPGGKPLKNPPPPVGGHEQTQVVFVEAYRDVEAFEQHVKGAAFAGFLQANLKHFYESPSSPGWPNSETLFYRREATVVRTGKPTGEKAPPS